MLTNPIEGRTNTWHC